MWCNAFIANANMLLYIGYIQKILGVLAQMEEDTDDMDDYFMDDTSDYDMDGDMSDEDIEEEAREYVCAVAPELPTCRSKFSMHAHSISTCSINHASLLLSYHS